MTPTRIDALSRHRNTAVSLPLFEAADRLTVRGLPLAARRLARRHGLPAPTAKAIAELVGYSVEGDR